jgi:hypothetical protein
MRPRTRWRTCPSTRSPWNLGKTWGLGIVKMSLMGSEAWVASTMYKLEITGVWLYSVFICQYCRWVRSHYCICLIGKVWTFFNLKCLKFYVSNFHNFIRLFFRKFNCRFFFMSVFFCFVFHHLPSEMFVNKLVFKQF